MNIPKMGKPYWVSGIFGFLSLGCMGVGISLAEHNTPPSSKDSTNLFSSPQEASPQEGNTSVKELVPEGKASTDNDEIFSDFFQVPNDFAKKDSVPVHPESSSSNSPSSVPKQWKNPEMPIFNDYPIKHGKMNDIGEKTFPFSSIQSATPSFAEVLRSKMADTSHDAHHTVQKNQHHTMAEAVSSVGAFTCADVLGSTLSLPEDADVNLICQQCYTFCLMELVLKTSLDQNTHRFKSEQLGADMVLRIQEDLKFVQALIPIFLTSCVAAFMAFRYQGSNLRQYLNELQKIVQNR